MNPIDPCCLPDRTNQIGQGLGMKVCPTPSKSLQDKRSGFGSNPNFVNVAYEDIIPWAISKNVNRGSRCNVVKWAWPIFSHAHVSEVEDNTS